MGIVLIESTAFALVVASYFYLRLSSESWPPPRVALPGLAWPTLNTVILLASCILNHWAKKAAERMDLRKVRVWMVVCLVFAVAFIAVRVLEFGTLNARWNITAYGSVVWFLLGLHTTHLVTDFLDSAVLAVLMFTGPVEKKRFVDVSENAFYWYFVVISWLPIYAVLYLVPRIL